MKYLAGNVKYTNFALAFEKQCRSSETGYLKRTKMLGKKFGETKKSP